MHLTKWRAALAAVSILTSVSLANVVAADSDSRERAAPPFLPPLTERYPTVFLEDGCERISPDDVPGAVVCPAPQGPGAADAVPTHLRGFDGAGFTDDISRGAVVLVESSVSTAASTAGSWTARGLVRNESPELIGATTVTAHLKDRTGQGLGTVSSRAAATMIRPGEPAAFEIASDVDNSQVADVTWEVTTNSSGPPLSRDLQIRRFWSQPHGSRPPTSVGEYSEPPGRDSYPYVLYGEIENLSDAALTNPQVSAAWVSAEGRVVHIARATMLALGTRGAPANVLLSRNAPGIADWVFVIDDPVLANSLESLDVMLWAEGTR